MIGALALASIAIGLLASGCGGDSSGETTQPPKRANPNKADSATNDVPPPPGSPQQAFEKQCEQNPQACG